MPHKESSWKNKVDPASVVYIKSFVKLIDSADLYAVQKLLGHKDGRMTQRYAHLSSEYLRDAINKLNKSATNLLHSEIKESAISL
jgi:site-specific recombinase XerC